MEPVSRRELIKRLRKLGFQGPFSARKHSVMSKGRLKLRIPNPHSGSVDIGTPLLDKILKEAGVSKKGWESTKS